MTCTNSPTPDSNHFLPPDPLAHALKTGTLADLPRVPEDADALYDRALTWYDTFKPQGHFHCWLVEQICITSIKIEHNGRIERRLRDRAVFRARQFWDEDRRLDAILLGEKLAKAPASVANQLRRTPQGCDYLIDRWQRLERIAQGGLGWDEAQCSLAFHMLGIPADERAGCGIDLSKDPLVVACGELLALRKRKEEVAGLDAMDRAMAEADYVHEPGEEVRRVRRRDAELQRWMKWCVEQIGKKSPFPHSSNKSHEFFRTNAPPKAETPPTGGVSPAVAVAEVAPAPPPAEAPDLVMVGEAEDRPEQATEVESPPDAASGRVRDSLKRAEARREAKRRRLDRRRA